MASPKNNRALILDDAGIRSKLMRIAYEIYESNYGQKSLVLIGIGPQGGYIGKALAKTIEKISQIPVEFISAQKTEDEIGIELKHTAPGKLIKGKHIIIVDDVLYSGTTMFRATAVVLNFKPKRIETATLIDRGHRTLPVWPNFTGLALATSLRQHVAVEINLKSGKAEAFLE